MVPAWVEVPTKGGVVARVAGVVVSTLGMVGVVTVVGIEGTAVVMGADVSVGGGCVVVVVVVGAVRTEGGDGVGFLVGGGRVGVDGINLMMEKQKQTKEMRGTEKKVAGRQN